MKAWLIEALSLPLSLMTLGLFLDKIFPDFSGFLSKENSKKVPPALTDTLRLTHDRVFQRFLGTSPFTRSYFFRCSLLSIAAVVVVYLWKILNSEIPRQTENVGLIWQVFLIVLVVLCNCVVDWFSYAQTQMFFRWAAEAKTKFESGIAIGSDLFISMNMFVIVFAITLYVPLYAFSCIGVAQTAKKQVEVTSEFIDARSSANGGFSGRLVVDTNYKGSKTRWVADQHPLHELKGWFNHNPLEHYDFSEGLLDVTSTKFVSIEGSLAVEHESAEALTTAIRFGSSKHIAIIRTGYLKSTPPNGFHLSYLYGVLHRMLADPWSTVSSGFYASPIGGFMIEELGHAPSIDHRVYCVGDEKYAGQITATVPKAWDASDPSIAIESLIDERFNVDRCKLIATASPNSGHLQVSSLMLYFFAGSPMFAKIDPSIFFSASLLMTFFLYFTTLTHFVWKLIGPMLVKMPNRLQFFTRSPFATTLFVFGVAVELGTRA